MNPATLKIYKKQGGWVFLRTEDRGPKTETEHVANYHLNPVVLYAE